MPKPEISIESYHETLLDALKDPGEAAHYLKACLEDGDIQVFLLAVRDVATAVTPSIASPPRVPPLSRTPR
jgi:DNA-binding phage protein